MGRRLPLNAMLCFKIAADRQRAPRGGLRKDGEGAWITFGDRGKLADIVLLDTNPLEDIKNTQTIWRVIKGGFVFDPEALRPDRN